MRVGAMADKNNAMKLTAACKLAPISPRVMVAIAKNLFSLKRSSSPVRPRVRSLENPLQPPDFEWVAQVSLLRPGCSGQDPFARETQVSKTATLGHLSLNIRPCHFSSVGGTQARPTLRSSCDRSR